MTMRTQSAVLLLGLRLNEDGSAREEMRLRAEKAAEIWKAGVAPVIVACGGKTGASERTEAQALRDALLNLGVSAESVLMEDQSTITLENIENARRILGDGRLNVALVTSDYHAFRAWLMCRGAGFRAKVYAARTPSGPEKRRARRMEALYFADYLAGWERPGKNRPAWAEKIKRSLNKG